MDIHHDVQAEDKAKQPILLYMYVHEPLPPTSLIQNRVGIGKKRYHVSRG